MKAYPKPDDIKKRAKRSANSNTDVAAVSKKPRVEAAAPLESTPPVTETGIDVTEQYVTERLSPELAADLVITAMVSF